MALIVGQEPGPARQRRPGRVLEGLHVLPAAPRPAGGVDHDDVRARPGPLRGPQGQGRVHRPLVARASAWSRSSASRPRSACWCWRRPIIGAFLQHGEFSEQAAVTTGRALAGFSIGLVGFSVYLFVLRGLLRPPGHPDAVRDQRRSRTCSTSSSRSLLVGRYGVLGLGPRLRARLPAERGVGAPGPVVQGARLRAATDLRQPGPDAAGRRC